MKKLMHRVVGVLEKTLSPFIRLIKRFAKSRPILFTLVLLLLLLLLIGVSDYMRQRNSTTEKSVKPVKKVQVFVVGDVPRVSVLGEVVKEHVVTVVAQNGGVISTVTVKSGDQVSAYKTLAIIGSDYQGNVLASVQKSLAGANYQHVAKTYDDQREIIAKQKEIAQASDENSSLLRDIQSDSLTGIEEQVKLNESLLTSVSESISALEQAPISSSSANTILAAKSSQSQILAGLEQLRASQRQIAYQASDDNPPAKIGQLSRDITIKQLELSEKALDLTKQTAALQVKLAQIAENTAKPAAPFAGTIEQVFVRQGMVVAPGAPIALLRGKNSSVKLTVSIPAHYASQLNLVESAYAIIDDQKIELPLPYIPQEVSANGQLSVQFQLEDSLIEVSDGQRVQVSLPLGNQAASTVFPLVPMETVYLGAQDATVLVAKDGKAKTQAVVVGKLFGDFVSILSGLTPNDQLILDRTIVSDENIEVVQ